MHNTDHRADRPQLTGIAALTRKLAAGADMVQMIDSAASDPDPANMLMGLSVIFQLAGNRAMELEHQAAALKLRQLYHLPSASGPIGIRLLALVTPGGMKYNMPVDFLLQDSDVALDLLHVSEQLPFPDALPEHDVLLVALGQSDRNAALLERLARLIDTSSRPVLNHPAHVARLSRDSVGVMLRGAPGVDIPVSLRLGRAGLRQLAETDQAAAALLGDGDYPLIARPLGSHGGRGLARIDAPAALDDYLAATAGEDFHIARFVDYRSADGQYRKYRIALIDGRPFACHMAISEHWMIHYCNAGMAGSAAKRAEEARFMASFDDDFARRHGAAFTAIGQRMGLDYLVIDCAETPQGELLVFEADNIGFVHATDPVDVFPYKQPQMRKVFAAFRQMLGDAARCRI